MKYILALWEILKLVRLLMDEYKQASINTKDIKDIREAFKNKDSKLMDDILNR